MTTARLLPLIIVTLLSGGAALAWETLWTRAFSVILGSTVEAAAATFAAFLVGLALGAWIPTRREWQGKQLVRWYAAVEVGIAVTAWAVAWLLHHHGNDLATILGARFDLLPKAILCFGVALVLVAVPTMLMGATFPLIVSLARQRGGSTLAIGRVYAGNVAGASLGCLVTGFWALRVLGLSGTMSLAAGLNLASAVAALLLLRAKAPAAEHRSEEACEKPEDSGDIDDATAATIAVSEPWLLVVAASSGLLILGGEILWTRLAGFFLGNRIYAFSTLLACVLAMLSTGSWLAEVLLRRFPKNPASVLAGLIAAAAVGCALSPALAMQWVAVQVDVESSFPLRDDLGLFYRVVETAVLLAPMLLPLGTLFPFALVASKRTEDATGRAAGTFYLVNTAGAVVGSLGVGFWGFAAIGSVGVAFTIVLLAATLAIGTALMTWRSGARTAAKAVGLSAVAAVLIASSLLPPTLVRVLPGEELLLRREDQTGVLQIAKRPDGQIAARLNATELIFRLGALSTSYVQQMQGHLGVLFHKEAKTALVLGSGYGITAGALAAHPGLERIDAVEIVPGLLDAAPLFSPYNLDYHKDPRMKIHVDDGRHFVARGQRWDIVSINVSDPHLPGGAALFHRDFLELVKQHLNPGGVVLLHAFGTDTAVVLKTLSASYPHVRLMRAYANGFNAVASERELVFDRDFASRELSTPSVQRALAMAGILPPVDALELFSGLWRLRDLKTLMPADTPIASDDHPVIEFAWHGPASRLLFINE